MKRVIVLTAIAGLLVAAAGLSQEDQPASFSFAVFGDTRPAGKSHYAPALPRIAGDIGRSDAEFVLGTGDYIDGSSNQAIVRAQFAYFFEGLAPLQAVRTIPVAMAPGNHDIMGVPANEAIFEEYFGHLRFSFNRGGCHFIILNTDGARASHRIDDAQVQWLRRDLEENKDALFTFVALHEPLFPVDGHVGSSLDAHPDRRDSLHALFVQQGVDCVFAGHEHLYNHQERDGVHYFITGGGGAPLYAPPDRGGFHHYLLGRVTGDSYEVAIRSLQTP